MLMTVVIGWTCIGVFIATALLTILALAKVIELAHKKYLDRLFKVLVLEIVAVCIGVFTGIVRDPSKVEKEIVAVGEAKGEEKGIEKGVEKAEATYLPEIRNLNTLVTEKQAVISRFESQVNLTPQDKAILKKPIEINEEVLKAAARVKKPFTRVAPTRNP